MGDPNGSLGIDTSGLRERLPQKPDAPVKAESVETAQDAVRQLNQQEQSEDKLEKDKKTYGRTPDGTVFTVPHTEDMVSQLFDPMQPKNASDIAIVSVLLFMGLIFYYLPQKWRIPVFAVIFSFWRMCYNAGIGWLLHNQSHHKRLIAWARDSKIFENPKSGNQPHPKLWKFLKREMEAKIPDDYKFEDAPIEYNTWLVFRRVVDLILMSDFISYCLFAIACGGRPENEQWAMTVARWTGGIALVAFNLWVKLDAHRVVGDFAWFWGDFFYLIDQDLTFDGVFELAPHPMYSVGYAGYYGISMMAASYKVLIISVLAQAAQLTFLSLVESPHIERTYNAPPPIKRAEDPPSPQTPEGNKRPEYRSRLMSSGKLEPFPPLASDTRPSPVHNLLGLNNIDLHRVTDVSVIVLQLFSFAVALVSPSIWTWQAFFVANAVFWRLWYTFGIGIILTRQSSGKAWTRHFVKYGDSTEEAWRQWKGIYHLSMVMCWTSFVCAAWKMYGLPDDWTYGMSTLRHVIGFALIALQLWTISEIYDSLGEFGWFFGDFFYDETPKLTYSGIYRFLNNPERTIGLAGLWGAALITWSKAIFFLALLGHFCTLGFIQFVERPHMQKLYHESIRGTSGVTRNIDTILPSPIQRLKGNANRVIDGGLHTVEDLIDAARPKLASGFNHIVEDSRTLLKQLPGRISISRASQDVEGFNPDDYTLKIDLSQPGVFQSSSTTSDREGESGQQPQRRKDSFNRLQVQYGAPIKVKWTAPLNHSTKDWIGLYMVADNRSRDFTRVSSQGRWTATNKGQLTYAQADEGILVTDEKISGAQRTDGTTQDYLSGEVEFSGDKLWWTSGVFEFRYHHDGRHSVMAMSLPFEVEINRFIDKDLEIDTNNNVMRHAVEEALLPVVQNCFDRDPDVAPQTIEEHFGPTLEREGKYAKRVVYAVSRMFGVEFAPEVVQADGTVQNMAWRITNAKKVLAPYSMTKGRSSPE